MTAEGKLVDHALPVFFALILVEWWFAPRFYRVNDAISSLTAGLCGAVGTLIWGSLLHQPYIWMRALLVEAGIALNIKGGPQLFIVFLGVDLSYYLGHRAAHMINLCWAGHGVHHSSEEYNLSTALRQSAFFEKFFSTVFRLYLCFFCDFTTYTWIFELNLIYQFWVHTSTISKLPAWFEAVFVTPSHHRVHHARNPQYIDKNFGGNLIIWDKLFGTFEPEQEPCIYGLVHPLETFDPVQVQLGHLQAVWEQVKETRGFFNKLKVCFYPPGFDFATNSVPPFPKIDPKQEKYDPKMTRREMWWSIINFVLVLGAGLELSVMAPTLRYSTTVFVALVIGHNLRVISATLEGRFSFEAEVVRACLNAVALFVIGMPLYILCAAPIMVIAAHSVADESCTAHSTKRNRF